MSWIIFTVLLLILVWSFRKIAFFKSTGIPGRWLIFIFLTKVLIGFVFIWIYSFHYTSRQDADVYKYFDDAQVLNEVRKSSVPDYLALLTGMSTKVESLTQEHLQDTRFWDRKPSIPYFNDNRFIIRFNAFVMLFSLGNIYVHLLLANYIAFIGLLCLYLFLLSWSGLHKASVLVSVFALPSLLFWTSSVLKESFLIFGFGAFLYTSLSQRLGKLLKMACLLLFGWIIAQSKIYVLFILIPLLIAHAWSKGRDLKGSLLRYSLVLTFFISLTLNVGIYFPEFDIRSLLAFKQSEFKCLAEWTGAGSQVFIPDLDHGMASFIKAIPHALRNALFRPMPWDAIQLIGLPSMMEILFIYALGIAGLLFGGKKRVLNKNFLVFSTFFILMMALLIGWTTPVLGAIVRYRIILLPFLSLMAFSTWNQEKMVKFVRKLPAI